MNRRAPIFAAAVALVLLILVVIFLVLVAALVLSRQPGNRVGWLLMVSVVTGPYLLAGQYVLLAGTTDGLLPSISAWLAGLAP